MVIKNWHPYQSRGPGYIVIALLILSGIFLFNYMTGSTWISSLNILALLGFFIFIVVYTLYDTRQTNRHRNFEYMIVDVEPRIAVKVAENALDNKNFPYVKSGATLRLKAEGLSIEVKNQHTKRRHSPLKRSSLWIGPISKSNFHIAQSLKAKIEDGFQLKGLD